MKSGKQKRAALRIKKVAKRTAAVLKARLEAITRGVAVDLGQLAPDGSYSPVDFIVRGYYLDQPFECQACGAPQTWTATARPAGVR